MFFRFPTVKTTRIFLHSPRVISRKSRNNLPQVVIPRLVNWSMLKTHEKAPSIGYTMSLSTTVPHIFFYFLILSLSLYLASLCSKLSLSADTVAAADTQFFLTRLQLMRKYSVTKSIEIFLACTQSAILIDSRISISPPRIAFLLATS